MSIKKTLHRLVCLLFISLFFTSSFAQISRTTAGKLFLRFSKPRTSTSPFLFERIHAPFRSYDGTNNNITNSQTALFGSVGIPLYREIPAEYGPSDPKNAMGGVNRPSPRSISNAVIDEPVTQFNERGLSAFIYVWGQFIDHDMSLTPTGSTEYVPIPLAAGETIFTEAIPFYRSEVQAGTGANSVRQQTNINTAWLDGSMVYGVDKVRAKWMRTGVDGKMKTSAGNFMPYNTVNGEKSGAIDPNAPDMANDSNHTVKTFVAGDVRAAEHPGIAGLHTLFVREHNKICDRLKATGIRNDELMYQLARKEVGALIQAITFQEFLPAIGITLNPYSGYKPSVRGDISNTFATAGYRIGHTMVADDIFLLTDDCEEIGPGELDLVDVFWNPQIFIDYGMEAYFKGFAAHTQYETDNKINDVLRNFLFVSPNNPVRFGIDLGSLNIQRGRDHGLPSYNTVRKYYTGSKANGFSQITSKKFLADSLRKLYGNVDNVDLWVGILAEDHLAGKSVGKTMHEILRTQFQNLRDGDFYYYKNDPFMPKAMLDRVNSSKFSDVLKRNVQLTSLQANVFFREFCPGHTDEQEESVSANAQKEITKDEIAGKMRAFPNPASGILNIDLGQEQSARMIQIISAGGVISRTINVAPNQRTLQVNVSDLKTGVYLINVYTGTGIKSLKFVKASN